MPEIRLPIRMRVGASPEIHVGDITCTPDEAADPATLPLILRQMAEHVDQMIAAGEWPELIPQATRRAARSRAMAMIVTSPSDDPAATAHARGWPVPDGAVALVEEFLFGMFGDPTGEGLVPMEALHDQAARSRGVYWRPGRGEGRR